MLKSYLKIAFRNILKNKGYSFICITGLALGMLVAFIVLFLVMHEMSYDRYQKEADRTFIHYVHVPVIDKNVAYSPIVFAATLKNKFPEIENIAQVRELEGEVNLIKGKDYYKIDNGFFADAEICKILSFNFISGNENSFSSNPNSVLISRSMLEKYFSGRKDVIGNTIKIKFYSEDYLAEVTGIYEDIPENSQFRPAFVLNNQIYKDKNEDFLGEWGYRNFVTYIHLKANVDKNKLFKKVNVLINTLTAEKAGNNMKLDYRFMPLTDVHLYSADIGGVFGKKGSMNKIYVYLAIGLLTLLIGCINFINISTAKSSARAKEIGVRLVIGASKRGVILQVLTESIMVSVLSLPVTLMLFEILKPYISEYFDRSFRINYLHDWQYLIGFMVIVLFVGVFSGLNSALIASKYTPVDILKSQNRIKSSKSYFRRALITFQFVIFTGMLVCSYVIYNQMNYLKNADLGYNKSNLVAVAIPFGKYNDEGRNIVNELKRNPHIIDASITSSIPPSFGNRVTRARASMNNQGKEIVQYQFLECDENYKNVLGLEMKEGKYFDETTTVTSDIAQAVINETAQKELGLKQPLGEIVDFTGQKIQIIGVIKDFNYNSLYDPITPLVFVPAKDMLAGVVIKVNNKNISAAINEIKEQWSARFPDYPFSFKFVDEELDKIYRKDQLFGTLITCFTIIATLIAVIGLAGLVAFTTSRRVKEIGVRKVLGAPVHNILFLLLKEIFVILIVGCIVSFPIAHYFMKDWLTTFVYRTEITSGVYFAVFITTLLIAVLAVGIQAVRAALANPVESLKYE